MRGIEKINYGLGLYSSIKYLNLYRTTSSNILKIRNTFHSTPIQ
jgi:hypothetical protein